MIGKSNCCPLEKFAEHTIIVVAKSFSIQVGNCIVSIAKFLSLQSLSLAIATATALLWNDFEPCSVDASQAGGKKGESIVLPTP